MTWSESQLEEAVGDIDSGLVDLHIKDMLKDESFISRSGLTLGGAILPGSARPQML